MKEGNLLLYTILSENRQIFRNNWGYLFASITVDRPFFLNMYTNISRELMNEQRD